MHKLSCFLRGLKDEICLPIWMLNPINLNAIYGLEKIQEEYLLSTKKINKPTVKKNSVGVAGNFAHSSYSNDSYSNWLCYHFDEKFSPVHHYKVMTNC